MSILGSFDKQPVEKEWYSISYEADLTDNDYVLNATATVVPATPSGLVIEQTVVLANRVRVFATGGADKSKYKITVTANTHDGRVLQDEFYIKVKDV